jgi:RimJ/RimL family protein N-acetyltransferase
MNEVRQIHTEAPCGGRSLPGRRARTLRAVDGRRFAVRRLRSADRAMYEAAVAGLSERSRYLRFGSPAPRLSERMIAQMMDLDERRHVAYAALTPDQARIVGVARYVRLDGEPGTAEVAIAIADEWQRVGVGPLLLNRLIEHARRAGVESLVAVRLGENRAAGSLARGAGFPAGAPAGIYVDYRMALERRAS